MKKLKNVLDKIQFCATITYVVDAALAHPVERHLAKVEVASSSLVSRSIKAYCESDRLFFISIYNIICACDGIGRHARFRFSCREAWGFESLQAH